jgi:hypothetical protein
LDGPRKAQLRLQRAAELGSIYTFTECPEFAEKVDETAETVSEGWCYSWLTVR